MTKPVVFMFGGQGTQYYQMGRELFLNHPVFRKWMLHLDKIVQKSCGLSVVDELYRENRRISDRFDRLLFTHPAIFMVEYALAQVLIEEGIEPEYVIGSSLGEFVAAALAGVTEVDLMLELVVKHAQTFECYCPAGGMIAILYDPRLYWENSALYENSELVSVNFDSHFVIAGKLDPLKVVQQFLTNNRITHQMLPVTYAFHSSAIDSVERYCLDLLQHMVCQKPRIPIVSSLYGTILSEQPDTYFWDIARQPIKFSDAFKSMESISRQNAVYLDLSPGGTLANFAKRNMSLDSESEVYSFLSPYNLEEKQLEILTAKMAKKKQVEVKRRKTDNMVTFMFPGQGSHVKGIGGTLFDEFPDYTAIADKVLGYSIKELCLYDPEKKLGKTQFTQPALYVVNALSYLKKVLETGRKPDFVVGHSLGEYNALFAAGAFDFETGLKLVKKRGELMGQARDGGMAAVIGLQDEKVEAILRENGFSTIDIANYNTPTQIVISGPLDDIEKAGDAFSEAGAMYIPLNVSGAFHSRYMKAAQTEFERYLDQFTFSELSIPVISNCKARPYTYGELKTNLVKQIVHSVKWTESIRYLMGLGEMTFEEIGPGDVLTKLVQKIREQAEPLVVSEEPAEEESIEGWQDKKEYRQEAESFISLEITATSLGDEEFKKDYKLKYAYLTGGMYRGIASKEMVVRMGKAGMMGFFGTGGLDLQQVEEAIQYIQRELDDRHAYGMNLVHQPAFPEFEEQLVDLYLRYGVKNLEASAFMGITPALIKFRAQGVKRAPDGSVIGSNHIIAKLSRPEVAEAFLSPAPAHLVAKMVEERKITQEQADLLKEIPMADDICTEADSGGHTDGAVAYALLPAILKLRDEKMKKYGYRKKVRVGAAGGIGTPEAAAAAFIMGADFILTGSINQCTVEAGTSDAVKDLLQQMNVQDTVYAPAGDMFEMGAKVQVLKKGVFFPARANKLYDLYRLHNSLDEIDERTKKQIQEKYFKRSFEEVYKEIKKYYPPHQIEKFEQNPKQKMAAIFKWYFSYSSRLALNGTPGHQVDYQIHCGPALGAFNQWVKGTPLEDWRNRHVDEIGEKLMIETAHLLAQRLRKLNPQLHG
ncbi:ACP S-malonyltransferase [Thermoflavimicrobium dichotomicum]|uniref:[acyl-carrier-protein] S-malonyltransferase n=1 Tax=Thermoflavimicrobium dichotomicum TaxID=46223 RepID=A0A1I3TKB7_9BACL|nr:ACP S-malonyltransferase [Thermoflavimicrobium dichotomicum]SFJ70066.1 trans-AT polyketide synthase, acyltransferase and oxidoreductase domain-containing protein [Thermoflavimicrobium dichotomicum]